MNFQDNDGFLFPLPHPELSAQVSQVKTPERPVWTENKSLLIERYLKLFLFITKNGVYIDGFAGPQRHANLDMWCAARVMKIQPYWLKHHYLFELADKSIPCLRNLIDELTVIRSKGFVAEIFHGDVNVELPILFDRNVIRDKSACFCLLDQRTFECHWSTVKRIAGYKKDGNKIEILYFLANGWLDRSLVATTRNKDKLEKWWGRPDYMHLRGMSGIERAKLMAKRFSEELGYSFVDPWAIYRSRSSRRVMYYLIHATDHPEAPKLMSRAYRQAVDDTIPAQQMELFDADPALREGAHEAIKGTLSI